MRYIFNNFNMKIFGDVRMFFMSVVRRSPIFEHTATPAFDNFEEARIEKPFPYSSSVKPRSSVELFFRLPSPLLSSLIPMNLSTFDFSGAWDSARR